MRDPSPYFPKLIEIFNIDKKSVLERHCRELVFHQQDLVGLILASQAGELASYRYANHFDRTIPPHLFPNEKNKEAFIKNGVGPFRSKEARKMASKIFQRMKDQRCLAAHLFYTPCHTHWYLFYFDNHDKTSHGNRWKYGPHIHLVCSLWPRLVLSEVWKNAMCGRFEFSDKLHIRYESKHN